MTRRAGMQRPSPEELDAYCAIYGVPPIVAWRDYLQLRLAEAISRDPRLKALCVWKGAFVMRYVLKSSRASGDLDATVGTNKDKVGPPQIRERLIKSTEDLGITIPKASEPDPRDQSVSFNPIVWRDAEIGDTVETSIDLSMRENVIMTPHLLTVDAGLVPAFEVLHMDLHEQAAEKMRCLAQRSKVGDGMDVVILWTQARLDHALVRELTPKKLTSGRDHRAEAHAGVRRRYEAWDNQIGRELPQDAPTKNEMREACDAAIDKWVPN
jgi:hypothetical protein